MRAGEVGSFFLGDVPADAPVAQMIAVSFEELESSVPGVRAVRLKVAQDIHVTELILELTERPR